MILWLVLDYEIVALIPLLRFQILHPVHLRQAHVATLLPIFRNWVLHLVSEKPRRQPKYLQIIQLSKILTV